MNACQQQGVRGQTSAWLLNDFLDFLDYFDVDEVCCAAVLFLQVVVRGCCMVPCEAGGAECDVHGNHCTEG